MSKPNPIPPVENKNSVVHFWAKTTEDGRPGVSVIQHMLDVGSVAQCLAETTPALLSRFNLQSNEVAALAALHDLGKISPGFQRKCEAWLTENHLEKIALNNAWSSLESDHGKTSLRAIQRFLTQKQFSRKSAKFLAAILASHHGRLKRSYETDAMAQKGIAATETRSGIDWEGEWHKAATEVFQHFDIRSAIELVDEKNGLWWLAGLTSVADWIGSNERFFSSAIRSEKDTLNTKAKSALSIVGFEEIKIKPGLSFKELFGFVPNEMQQASSAHIKSPGTYVIEAPMGMGKTEAALGVAYNLLQSGSATGIYFALPTQATSNRIHIRFDEFIKKISPDSPQTRLIHGNSWLMQEVNVPKFSSAGGDERENIPNGYDWFASSKRALLAPFGVGTIDQALLAVIAAKHFFVRQYALAGKVLILDEIHTYDIYTGTLLDELVKNAESLGCTVIVLSATLTSERREELISLGDSDQSTAACYPLISGKNQFNENILISSTPPTDKQVALNFEDKETCEEEALNLAREGGVVLWICNTVDNAQKQFECFSAKTQSAQIKLGLLHSRFPFQRRAELEEEWMELLGKEGKGRCGSILVSTQIVEQSVDIDADLLVTELAPTDMILQRIGRLWRHKRVSRPIDYAQVFILKENLALQELRTADVNKIEKCLGSKAKVYSPYVLLRSLEVLSERSQIRIPSQIRALIERTYENVDNIPIAWEELLQTQLGKQSAYRYLALRNTSIWSNPTLRDEEGAQTRLNEMPTVLLVLVSGIEESKNVIVQMFDGETIEFSPLDFSIDIARKTHRNIVKAPEYCFDFEKKPNLFDRYLYGKYVVGVIGEDGRIVAKGIKSDYALSYDPHYGLLIDKISTKEAS
ncbi:MAG: CRISPR-associated helicase Cas3' [Proteobacteria bacterium]|nr:CRISPR-associated helicase Cas3' [Pseudomonadota bacterium]